MKQIVQARPRRSRVTAPITILSIPNVPDSATLVKEVETTTVIRERTYLVIRPVCSYCGEEKERIAAMTWICENGDCPSNDPAPAIPLREEGKNLIDVKPIKEAA